MMSERSDFNHIDVKEFVERFDYYAAAELQAEKLSENFRHLEMMAESQQQTLLEAVTSVTRIGSVGMAPEEATPGQHAEFFARWSTAAKLLCAERYYSLISAETSTGALDNEHQTLEERTAVKESTRGDSYLIALNGIRKGARLEQQRFQRQATRKNQTRTDGLIGL